MFAEIRKQEKKYLLYAAIMNSISAAVIPVTPTLASVATISTFRAFGNDISASTVSIKTKRQITVQKTQQRKLKNDQHEPHQKLG